MLKSTLTLLGLAFVLAACDPVPTTPSAGIPIDRVASGPVAASQMNAVFETYTPLSFKAMRLSEMRQRLKAGGYQRVESKRTSNGETQELWYGVIKRGGQPVSRTRVRLTTCKGSTIVRHSRSTLDDMTASFAREVQSFIRARPNLIIKDERQTQYNARLRFILLGADGPQGRNRDAVTRGGLVNALGGLRIFDNGQRRLGITIHTKC